MQEIEAHRIQEIENRNSDLQFRLKNELKEKVAKFIYIATKLNAEINNIIDEDSDYFHEERGLYSLREELKNLYYSIRVTLDGTRKQIDLENILTSYMNITCFAFDFADLQPDDYEQPLGHLFHKIKSIIHFKNKKEK